MSGGLDDTAVGQVIDARFDAFGDTLGPHLRPGFDALLARRKWGAAHPGWYTAPESQPIVVLVRQVAEAFADALPTDAVLDAVESAMLGYAYVRVHDDWLDDGVLAGDAPTTALLADALFARHQAVTARAVGGDASYWDLFARTWADFGEAMLLERDLLAGKGTYDAAAFESVLLRSRPMLLPPAALLTRARETDRIPALTTLVHAVARASQLLDDAVDVLDDYDAGAMNYLVQRFGGRHGREALLMGWVLGGFATAWEEADDALGIAETAAVDVGIGPAFAAFADQRRVVMERIKDAAWSRIAP